MKTLVVVLFVFIIFCCKTNVEKIISRPNSMPMLETQIEGPHGWAFGYGTKYPDTSFCDVYYGSKLTAYKKNNFPWVIIDTALWKRFLDTIEIIRKNKQI